MDNQFKEYVVCEEIIHNRPSGCFSIRANTDCSAVRFIVRDYFDTFEEADEFCRQLRNCNSAG